MAVRVFKLGSSVTDTPADILRGSIGISVVNNYQTPLDSDGNDLQVSAGKTFHITRLWWNSVTATAQFAIGYGDDASVGGAAPTNPVVSADNFIHNVANEIKVLDILIKIPATKFPVIQSLTAGALVVQIEGIEV